MREPGDDITELLRREAVEIGQIHDTEMLNELGRLGWYIPDDPGWAHSSWRLWLAWLAIAAGCVGFWLMVGYAIYRFCVR